VLRDLSINVKRGALALFTSYSMLNRTYNALKPDLQGEGILLLGQGIDGSRAGITERFKDDRASMLLGTDSFWEGVDIPGDALEILSIVRLPFAVPSEPIVAAHMEELEKQGKDSFLHYSVPEAILKFRQGFGRLIRNKTDRGVVIVLDSRVLTTRYGQAFLEALPVAHKTFQTPQNMIQTICKWFAHPQPAPTP
jgi:ATP-dependent DNA helicase DinG